MLQDSILAGIEDGPALGFSGHLGTNGLKVYVRQFSILYHPVGTFIKCERVWYRLLDICAIYALFDNIPARVACIDTGGRFCNGVFRGTFHDTNTQSSCFSKFAPLSLVKECKGFGMQ